MVKNASSYKPSKKNLLEPSRNAAPPPSWNEILVTPLNMCTWCRYATILAFDVKVERDAQDLADTLGVKIFQADIIYHLFDKFMAYREELRQKKRDEFKHIAVFPCKLKILPQVCIVYLIISSLRTYILSSSIVWY